MLANVTLTLYLRCSADKHTPYRTIQYLPYSWYQVETTTDSCDVKDLQLPKKYKQNFAAVNTYHTISYQTKFRQNILNISYHKISYHTYHTIHTIPYHTIPYHTIPYETIPYTVQNTTPYIPHYTIPYNIRHTISHFTIP